jgi:GMP synthase-like glutamine amidotransferase
MKFHVLRHVAFEGLGAIESWLQTNQHTYDYILFYHEHFVLPLPEDVDGLIILGGPMGVYETDSHPWLLEEMAFIKDIIDLNKPVLGICLGAQLIAKVLGANVSQHTQLEIGWYPIKLTSAGREHPLMAGFSESTTVLHWHGDSFEIPKNTIHLCSSEACSNQGFIYKDNVFGLQFHIELRRPTIQKLIENAEFTNTDAPFVQTPETMMSMAKHHDPACDKILDLLLIHWLSLAK